MNGAVIPPHGTKCADCGCCEAAIYAGDVAICWECDAGTHVRVVRKQVEAPSPIQAGESKAKELAVTEKLKRKQGQRVPDATRMAILAEPETMCATEIARKYGVSDVFVLSERRSQRKQQERLARTAVTKPEKAVETPAAFFTSCATVEAHPGLLDGSEPELKAALGEIAQAAVRLMNGEQTAEVKAPTEPAKVSVAIEIDEATANAFWTRLPLASKAWLIEKQFVAMLGGE